VQQGEREQHGECAAVRISREPAAVSGGRDAVPVDGQVETAVRRAAVDRACALQVDFEALPDERDPGSRDVALESHAVLAEGERIAPERMTGRRELVSTVTNPGVSLRADGRVLLELKTPWSDGTTHHAYEPLDFLAKLAALIPRPHKNLVLYLGQHAAVARVPCARALSSYASGTRGPVRSAEGRRRSAEWPPPDVHLCDFAAVGVGSRTCD